MPERGEIWLANLNPRRGTEPGKTRPVLIVQAQALLDAGNPPSIFMVVKLRCIGGRGRVSGGRAVPSALVADR
jgi:mRNA-degrading endonuclease toxin of MazEF toxin-antitoxin module